MIVETLNKVKNLGISSSEGQNTLLDAKNGLLAHLNDQLYPFLNKVAENDDNLKQTLEMFAKNMCEISKAALDFFSKYSKGGSGLEFAKDFVRLYTTFSERISEEESIIFKNMMN